jgi:hypothetical protein
MMMKSMSLTARRELLAGVKQKYRDASWADKVRVLDGFVAATGYERKYAIVLLNNAEMPATPKKRPASQKYDEQVRQALCSVWCAANQICSKRLVPFLPQLVKAMEHHGHLRLPADVRAHLLSISSATVDRILRPDRERIKQGVSTTRRGTLLKHQIQVRTFADWDDVTPGFLEADLVAHCGGNTNGAFLNTLVLVDISTGWLECMPLLRKSAQDVIDSLRVADELLPFTLQGLDTDCGSEFINYDLLDYCEDRLITFTRARTHRKNDQAHVEEKNGSVVRRLVGYDRFEGRKAWEALAQLYRVLRKYVNFFQPSLKLLAKERQGAKVSKKYDSAKTPFQRILLSEHISQEKKESLTVEYEALDPVDLLAQLETLQDKLWKYSWDKNGHAEANFVVTKEDVIYQNMAQPDEPADANRYYRSSKKVDLRRAPRTWRTRKDPFENVWDEIRLRLELIPETTARTVIQWLMEKYPSQFSAGQTRTLQRRIAQWRKEQESQEEKLRALMINETPPPPTYSITSTGIQNTLDRGKEYGEITQSLP